MKYFQRLLPFLSISSVSATVLMAQILMARQSRIAFGFGLEFIIFSFAIAGIGMGGLFIYLIGKKKTLEQMNKFLSWLFPAFTLLTLIPFALLHVANMLEGTLFFIFSLLFYFVGGVLVSTILRNQPKAVPRLYFFDLLGAAFGAFFVIYSMNTFGTSDTVLTVFTAGVVSAILYLFYLREVRSFKFVLLIISAIVVAFINKDYFQVKCPSEEAPLLVTTNSFSQLSIERDDLTKRTDTKAVLGIKPDEYPPNVTLYRMIMECKGISGSFILNFDQLRDTKFLLGSIYNFPYLIRNYKKVVELGTGPGNATITAALNDVPYIAAVDINPLVISTVRKFVHYDIYADPRVHLELVEGRNFINTTKQTFDLIFLFTREFGGIGTSSYAFSENYLFTKEAYNSYLDKLSPSGILGLADNQWLVSNWVPSLIMTLKERGLDPSTHIIILEGQKYSLVMVAKNGFSPEELGKLAATGQGLGFKLIIFTDEVTSRYLKNQLPVTDDKPSFININNLGLYLNGQGQGSSDLITGELSSATFKKFLYLLALSFVFYIVTAILPFKLKDKKHSDKVPILVLFFSTVAIGFATFELSVIQKLAIFLSKPEYPVSIALASILFFGGLGSHTVTKVDPSKLVSRAKIIILTFLVVATSYLAFSDLFLNSVIALGLGIRIATAILVLAIPSFLMGTIFPIGLRLTVAVDKNLIPWMFAVDGVATVFGGILSKIVFLIFGFKIEFSIVILMYALALLILCRKGIGIKK